MLEHLERQKSLTTNQWKIFAAATVGDMLDFFDFYLIGFVLAFIVGAIRNGVALYNEERLPRTE